MADKAKRPAAYRPPVECPVCADRLVTTRLGCASCGSELAGHFEPCEFCALDAGDLDLVRVFLASRGNIRELEKHLGVSYPTARLRLTAVLRRLGLDGDDLAEPQLTREQVLAEVAAGALTPVEAQQLLLDLS
jgi:hypothetical protein